MKNKILFGITSLGLGGAERVLVDLCNRLSKDYYITIFTIYDGGELKKQLDSKIKTISLYDKPYEKYNCFQKLLISLKLLLVNKIEDVYDIRVAFLEGPITRLFSKESKAKKIAWIHNDISKVFGNNIKSKIKKKFDKKIYKKYDKIIFVSEDNKKSFDKIYEGKFDELVIRNYIDYKKVIEKANEKINLPFNKNDINLVSVCRLVNQKAIDRFIKVHAKLEENGIHTKVYIVGDGPLRYTLQKQIDKIEETENFYLIGAKENPYPYIKNADYFCLLSYYEGYGMVIEEAKILNKTIIITDTAARECIEDYENSIVLENTESGIYEGLKKVLSENSIREEQEYNEFNIQYLENIIEQIKKIFR